MKRLEVLVWIGVVLMGLFAAIGLVAMVAYLYKAVEADSGKSQAVAAWAQAIGSIAAIAVALYIPARQRAHDRRERHLENLERTNASMQVLLWTAREAGRESHAAMGAARPSPSAMRVVRFQEGPLQDIVERLKRLHENSTDETLQSKCIGLRLTIEVLINFMRQHNSATLQPGGHATDPLGLLVYTSAVDSFVHDITDYSKSLSAQLQLARAAFTPSH